MTKIRNLILGAGISGLSLGTYYRELTEKDDYLILEKEEKAGGLCRSFKVGESVFDYSGHFLHFTRPSIKEDVLNRLDDANVKYETYQRNAGILTEHEIIDYPFQANIHQLPKDEFIKCLTSLYFKEHKEEKNFYDSMLNTFGTEITDRFFKPYNEKLYQTELQNLDVEAMQRFLPKVTFEDVMKNMKEKTQLGYNSEVMYLPKTGIEGLVSAFQPNMLNIRYAEEVINIDLNKKVVTTTKDKYKYQILINTLPLNTFIALCPTFNDFDFAELDAVNVDVFNISFDSKVMTDKYCWLYIPDKQYPFYRIGLYNYFTKSEKTSLYVEVSRRNGDTVSTVEDVLEHLKRTGLLDTSAKVTDTLFLKMSPAYVLLKPGTERVVDKLVKKLNSAEILVLGRYGLWTYQSIEDCIFQGKVSADILSLL